MHGNKKPLNYTYMCLLTLICFCVDYRKDFPLVEEQYNEMLSLYNDAALKSPVLYGMCVTEGYCT